MTTKQASSYFGDYLIKRKVGMGGMASVYLAVHQTTEQEVALKILHEHFADDAQIRKRIESEARIAMALNHPYIVPVWDFGQVGKRPYLIMPYMDGGSMAQYFSQPRNVKHETTLHLLSILGGALDYAHSQGVIHRDIKLENILIHQSLPAISDFGIAQSADITRITMTGQVLGTPQYLAPESLDDVPIDYHADLYSMAVMAYLMLTGYYPFTGKDALTIAVKLHTEAAPTPSLINPSLPIHLDKILLRGLAKNPQERFESAKDFVDALYRGFSQVEIADSMTLIYVDALNPFQSTPQAVRKARKPNLPHLSDQATHVFSNIFESIPLPHPNHTAEKPKSSRWPLLALLLVSACSITGFAFLALSQGNNLGVTPVEITENSAILASETLILVLENTQETHLATEMTTSTSTLTRTVTATNSPTPSASRRATATTIPNFQVSPSSTLQPIFNPQPRPNSTNRPSNTARPINTVRASATNTPYPTSTDTQQATLTNIPPTDIPPTEAPPTDVPPTDVPQTDAPPTDVPATDVSPTDPPPLETILHSNTDPLCEPPDC